MASYIQLASGGTQYDFVFMNANFDMDIDDNSIFIADLVDGTTEVESEGIVRKTVSLSVELQSEQGGDTAAVQFFNTIEFLRSNISEQMTLNIELDGGDLVKNYTGKFAGKLSGGVDTQAPNSVLFSFAFIIEGLSW